MPEELNTPQVASQSKQGKTPLAKQARRDKKALQHWKNTAVEKTEIVKSERRMKEESRKERDEYKDMVKKLEADILEKNSQENRLQKLYEEEQQRRFEAEELLEDIKKELKETQKKIDALVPAQAGITSKIYDTHKEISNHLYEQNRVEKKNHSSEEQKKIANQKLQENKAKIGSEIQKIEEDIQKIRIELNEEQELQNIRKEKINKIDVKKKSMKKQ